MDDAALAAALAGAAPSLKEAALERRPGVLARARKDVPATATDAAAVLLQSALAAGLTDDALFHALRSDIRTRLSPLAWRDPAAAFARADRDLEALTGRAPALPAGVEPAGLVAAAAGLGPAAAPAFIQRLAAAEQDHRVVVRAVCDRALALHGAEKFRLGRGPTRTGGSGRCGDAWRPGVTMWRIRWCLRLAWRAMRCWRTRQRERGHDTLGAAW